MICIGLTTNASLNIIRMMNGIDVSFDQWDDLWSIFLDPDAILELATNFRLLVLSILHNHKRVIKQASLSHWVAEYNLKVSSVMCKMESTSNQKLVANSNIVTQMSYSTHRQTERKTFDVMWFPYNNCNAYHDRDLQHSVANIESSPVSDTSRINTTY